MYNISGTISHDQNVFQENVIRQALNYLRVLKPLPSLLLTFIGVGTAIIAADGALFPGLYVVALAILLASAGANGLTNYLDREIDARMARTRGRVLPARRIYPPQKVLPLILTLIIIGLVVAWWLHPFVFLADLLGTVTAATWRKKVTCVYPQGLIASCAPVLMGWFAVRPDLTWEVLLLCLLIAAWLPLHVWSVIIAHREDYLQAGLDFFPVNCAVKDAVKVLLVFALALYAASFTLYFVGHFSWLYLVTVSLLGLMMVYASARLVLSHEKKDAWRLYKLSSFPYLGLLFVVMCLDIWLLG